MMWRHWHALTRDSLTNRGSSPSPNCGKSQIQKKCVNSNPSKNDRLPHGRRSDTHHKNGVPPIHPCRLVHHCDKVFITCVSSNGQKRFVAACRSHSFMRLRKRSSAMTTTRWVMSLNVPNDALNRHNSRASNDQTTASARSEDPTAQQKHIVHHRTHLRQRPTLSLQARSIRSTIICRICVFIAWQRNGIRDGFETITNQHPTIINQHPTTPFPLRIIVAITHECIGAYAGPIHHIFHSTHAK
jgi:hypothetical protein